MSKTFKKALVATDIQRGARLLDELQRRGVSVTAAFWMYTGSLNEWRLMIVSERPDWETSGLLRDILQSTNKEIGIPIRFIDLLSPADETYKALRQATSSVVPESVAPREPVRNLLMEHAYVYLVA